MGGNCKGKGVDISRSWTEIIKEYLFCIGQAKVAKSKIY